MKNIYIISLLFIAIITSANSCRKKSPDPEFYIKCKVDGQEYLPNNCANCMVGKLLQDTILIIGANRGFETLGIGINDKSGIKVTTYLLNEVIGRRGDYKNSTTTNDRFFTDTTHKGELHVTALDKTNSIISGTFYFQAYNPVQNKTVNVTEGKFRVKYIDY